MFSWKNMTLASIAMVLCMGCEVVTTDRYKKMVHEKSQVESENDTLVTKLDIHKKWKVHLLKIEENIHNLEDIVAPIAPLTKKNKAIMSSNKKEGEEAGGGAISEIFYLVQSAYAELDKQSASIANDISNAFNQNDFAQTYLFYQLEDKVFGVTMEIAEMTLRSSHHMATDRRLVTARLKAINECFMALRNLSQNQAFDLTYKQQKNLIHKLDHIRTEYAKVLTTDYFPAIPHFIPLASGEDYLKVLDNMNAYIKAFSVFYENARGTANGKAYQELSANLSKKKNALKSAK